MILKSIAAVLAALALPLAASAQDSDPLAEALAASVLEIGQAEDGSLSGPGLDRLLEEARSSQFFLVGEQHATREIALAEIDLHRRLAPEGFDYMVVEIGPESTREAERLIRSGDDALGDYIRTPGHQFVFPFIFFEEELALVEQGVVLSPRPGHALWGVDQEFIGAAPLLGQLLLAGATSEPQHRAAQAFIDGSGENFMHLGTAADEDVTALLEAFSGGSEHMRSLAEDIALSHEIYGPFVRGTGPIYPANLARENYMKRNFLAHFGTAEAQAGEPPRAFFKFGGFHMERGLSGTDVPSLANFVIEWGRARNFRAVNLMIDCLGGEGWGLQQSAPVACDNYAGLAEDSPLFAAMGDADAALYDLASLRPLLGRFRNIDPDLRGLILSYDYYLVIRDVTPATPVTDLTFPGS